MYALLQDAAQCALPARPFCPSPAACAPADADPDHLKGWLLLLFILIGLEQSSKERVARFVVFMNLKPVRMWLTYLLPHTCNPRQDDMRYVKPVCTHNRDPPFIRDYSLQQFYAHILKSHGRPTAAAMEAIKRPQHLTLR